MATGIPADRTTKRQKADGGPMGGPPEGYRGYPAGRYHQPPRYAPGPGGPSMGPGGYMPWQHAQYGGPPPPHGWPHGTPPPGSMYMQQGGPPAMTPDRQGYGPSAYPRGGPPMRGPPSVQRPSKAGPPPGPGTRPPSQTPDGGSSDAPPQPTYKGGWGPGGQWPPSQWGSGPPPPGWQGAGPPMHHPPGYGGPPPPSMYGTSPPRSAQQRPPRGTPDMTGTYGGPPSSVVCQTIDNSEMEMYHSRGVGPGMDDESSVSVTGGNSSSKDKGRGSYKCGRVSFSWTRQAIWIIMSRTITHASTVCSLFYSVEYQRRAMYVPISQS